jgi:hypothetical protein
LGYKKGDFPIIEEISKEILKLSYHFVLKKKIRDIVFKKLRISINKKLFSILFHSIKFPTL